MGVTTTYGYKKPQSPDTGETFWDDLEFDISRLDSHSHNGTDSAQLSGNNVTPVSDTIEAADWVAVSGQAGTYSQTVTVPLGVQLSKKMPNFRLSTGEVIHPSVEILGETTYNVFINDNTLELDVFYV